MLTQTYQVNTPLGSNARQMTPFLAKAMHGWLTKDTFLAEERGIGVTDDSERFCLVVNETVKIGTPVSRNDADYWIEQMRARALGEGEMVGRVMVTR
jgi:hypothetical protein